MRVDEFLKLCRLRIDPRSFVTREMVEEVAEAMRRSIGRCDDLGLWRRTPSTRGVHFCWQLSSAQRSSILSATLPSSESSSPVSSLAKHLLPAAALVQGGQRGRRGPLQSPGIRAADRCCRPPVWASSPPWGCRAWRGHEIDALPLVLDVLVRHDLLSARLEGHRGARRVLPSKVNST